MTELFGGDLSKTNAQSVSGLKEMSLMFVQDMRRVRRVVAMTAVAVDVARLIAVARNEFRGLARWNNTPSSIGV